MEILEDLGKSRYYVEENDYEQKLYNFVDIVDFAGYHTKSWYKNHDEYWQLQKLSIYNKKTDESYQIAGRFSSKGFYSKLVFSDNTEKRIIVMDGTYIRKDYSYIKADDGVTESTIVYYDYDQLMPYKKMFFSDYIKGDYSISGNAIKRFLRENIQHSTILNNDGYTNVKQK